VVKERKEYVLFVECGSDLSQKKHCIKNPSKTGMKNPRKSGFSGVGLRSVKKKLFLAVGVIYYFVVVYQDIIRKVGHGVRSPVDGL
jgi:hypothetical protein